MQFPTDVWGPVVQEISYFFVVVCFATKVEIIQNNEIRE